MTIEEKAKAYDRVAKEVKDFFEGRQKMYSDVEQTLEYLFPELAESEDEKIRKELIEHCRNTRCVTEEGAERMTKYIAWLEKQEGCEYIKKDWLEHIKQSWYKEGFIDGKYTPKELTINDATTLNELIDFLENGTVKLQHDLTLYANWLKTQFPPNEKQGEQKPAIEMKSAEESLGIDSETYNKIVDECIYGDDKQKPAWSEEDERTIHNIDAAIRHKVEFPIDELKSMKIWLESLKYRIRPKHEWKRDEKMFQLIEDVIDVYRKTQGSVIGGVHTEELKDYLKSLKPQNTWKPSIAQLNALSIVSKGNAPDDIEAIVSLYNDLKKLKGE